MLVMSVKVMALELIHCYRLRKQNGGAVGGNVQIKGR